MLRNCLKALDTELTSTALFLCQCKIIADSQLENKMPTSWEQNQNKNDMNS